MGRKPQVQTRLPTETYDDYEVYRDTRDLSDAEASRRLIRAGLRAEPLEPPEESESDKFDTRLTQVGRPVQLAGGAVIALSLAVIVATSIPTTAITTAATAAAAAGAAAIGATARGTHA